MTGGAPVRSETVVEGLKLANVVRWKDDSVYVSDTFYDLPERPGAAGICRFRLSELGRKPIRLKPVAWEVHPT